MKAKNKVAPVVYAPMAGKTIKLTVEFVCPVEEFMPHVMEEIQEQINPCTGYADIVDYAVTSSKFDAAVEAVRKKARKSGWPS